MDDRSPQLPVTPQDTDGYDPMLPFKDGELLTHDRLVIGLPVSIGGVGAGLYRTPPSEHTASLWFEGVVSAVDPVPVVRLALGLVHVAADIAVKFRAVKSARSIRLGCVGSSGPDFAPAGGEVYVDLPYDIGANPDLTLVVLTAGRRSDT